MQPWLHREFRAAVIVGRAQEHAGISKQWASRRDRRCSEVGFLGIESLVQRSQPTLLRPVANTGDNQEISCEGWKEAARAFLEGCRTLGVSAALERSRSGLGGDVWLFFEEAITAVSARRLGSFILTESMDRHSSISLGSYDRFFPNQDRCLTAVSET